MSNIMSFFDSDGIERKKNDTATKTDIAISTNEDTFKVILKTLSDDQEDRVLQEFQEWVNLYSYDTKKFTVTEGEDSVIVEIAGFFGGDNYSDTIEELTEILDKIPGPYDDMTDDDNDADDDTDSDTDVNTDADTDDSDSSDSNDSANSDAEKTEIETPKDYSFTDEEIAEKDPAKFADSYLTRLGY